MGTNGRLQSNYAFARAGLNIKRINGLVREGALWSTLDAISHLDPFNVSDTKWDLDYDYKPNVATVYKDVTRTSWVVGEAYRFQVSYRPTIGYIQVRIFHPSVSSRTLTLAPSLFSRLLSQLAALVCTHTLSQP
jgi:hypothetical protein